MRTHPDDSPLSPTAEEIHESAQLVLTNFPAFYNAYREWIKQGFNQPPRSPAKK
jgi:hypothetical protein